MLVNPLVVIVDIIKMEQIVVHNGLEIQQIDLLLKILLELLNIQRVVIIYLL